MQFAVVTLLPLRIVGSGSIACAVHECFQSAPSQLNPTASRYRLSLSWRWTSGVVKLKPTCTMSCLITLHHPPHSLLMGYALLHNKTTGRDEFSNCESSCGVIGSDQVNALRERDTWFW